MALASCYVHFTDKKINFGGGNINLTINSKNTGSELHDIMEENSAKIRKYGYSG